MVPLAGTSAVVAAYEKGVKTMRRVAWVLGAAAFVAGGCEKRPSTLAVCEQLVAERAASDCQASAPGGLGAAAVAKTKFKVPGLKSDDPEAGGQVLQFEKSEDYQSTIRAFDSMAFLAGRHRYGSPSALIFVQMNSETPSAAADAAKRVVEGL